MTENTAPTTIEELAPKMKVQGIVKKIELYGALVDIGIGRLGLLHISQISDEHVKNVSDILTEGDEITAWIRELDRKQGRVNLTMLEPPAVTWSEISENDIHTGKVVRIEKFGAFVDIGAERPGLVHVSELAKGYVGDPSDVVEVGDEIEVKVIGVNRRKRQIDLSVRALDASDVVVTTEEADTEKLPTAMELALRQAMEDSGMEVPESDKKRKRKKNKRREAQEDIFARTLQEHSSSE
jgi:small subunit ribosomal protein S1